MAACATIFSCAIYLAPDISCETQRSAIAIADALRATVDSVTSATTMATHGPENADQRFAVMPEREVATLTELSAAIATNRDAGGLLDAILRGKYVAIIADAEGDDGTPVDRGRAAALMSLTQALNGLTRCALISLRGGGNRSGAEACLTAHTGYPAAVDFSTGCPRYRPHDGALARLSRGAVDVALVVGSVGLVPPTLIDRLAGITTIVVGPRATESALAATATIDSGRLNPSPRAASARQAVARVAANRQ